MAQETQTKVEEVVVAEAEKAAIENPSPPVPEVEVSTKPAVVEEVVAPATEEAEKPKTTEEKTIVQSVSFKEESNVVSDLPDPEKKAFEELKQFIQEALNKQEFTASPPLPMAPKEEKKPKEEEKKAETEEAPAPAEDKPAAEEEVATAVTEEPPKTGTSEVAESALATEVVEEKKEAPSATPKEEKKEEVTPPEPEPVPESALALAVEAEASVAVDEHMSFLNHVLLTEELFTANPLYLSIEIMDEHMRFLRIPFPAALLASSQHTGGEDR